MSESEGVYTASEFRSITETYSKVENSRIKYVTKDYLDGLVKDQQYRRGKT
ncbi:hypothetical protein LF817_15410 [Halobacillus sp. A1]|uniref:hypothetical protein n=1 Tax=Halobacillus sp. A1 TaxID=2880262 RepID=UPI0020A61FDA|nr:hypothetical protein [Halobacillus sp. A1]MCP3032711.1 hypothetical protein [Halobacillus sp. A1]